MNLVRKSHPLNLQHSRHFAESDHMSEDDIGSDKKIRVFRRCEWSFSTEVTKQKQ